MEGNPKEERRRLERFALRVPATVHTVTSGAERTFLVYTSDVSRGGAFFPFGLPLAVGENLAVTLFVSIPAFERPSEPRARAKIVTSGRVVRAGASGTAVEFVGRYSMSRQVL